MESTETTNGETGLILTLNAGSSSLKFALFADTPTMPAMVRGEISDLQAGPHLVARDGAGRIMRESRWPAAGDHSFATSLDAVLDIVDSVSGDRALRAVGHRIVHGGPDHVAPERLTPAVVAALEALIPLDPMHMPHNLAAIGAVGQARPAIEQFACFDTAFHHTMPPVAQRFALPRALSEAGVRRYGFHGLSYEYIAGRLASEAPALAEGRVIVAHLGAGASLCALDKGISIATTFGISVLDGLVMATRCGNLDPGVIFYLGRLGHSLTEIEEMLYNRSGLLGVSGTSGDLRVLLVSDDAHAREAIELFTYRIALEIGAMASALGGLDGIVFTAGIGQHSPVVRAAICDRLGWLGVRLDRTANHANAPRIGTDQSRVDVRMIATDEESMIAQHVRAMHAGTKP